jgi:hypothetical protein
MGKNKTLSICLLYRIYYYYLFIHMCIHCLGHFSPLPFFPLPPHFQEETVLPLSLILLKRRHKYNKEDKEILLVKDNYTERFLALLSCTNVLQAKLIHL